MPASTAPSVSSQLCSMSSHAINNLTSFLTASIMACTPSFEPIQFRSGKGITQIIAIHLPTYTGAAFKNPQ